MLSLQEIQELIANEFLDGSMELAGIGIFLVAVLAVFALSNRNTYMALIVGMGVTIMFSLMGVLSTEVTVLMIIVSVLGLAYSARSVWRD